MRMSKRSHAEHTPQKVKLLESPFIFLSSTEKGTSALISSSARLTSLCGISKKSACHRRQSSITEAAKVQVQPLSEMQRQLLGPCKLQEFMRHSLRSAK
eukprot:6203253-Pleurochrysis_carterae.AAC.2